jgi:hypothetical protein
MKTYELVLSYYINNNIEWIDNLNIKTTIYNKTNEEIANQPSILLPNVGREIHTYFYHIINNYDNLHDWTYFSQAYPLDHVDILPTIINEGEKLFTLSKINVTNEAHFFSNGGHFGQALISQGDGTPHHPGLDLNGLWLELFKETPPPLEYEFTPGAICCVSNKRIQSKPKEFYEKCLDLTINRINSPWEFERILQYIFNDKIK